MHPRVSSVQFTQAPRKDPCVGFLGWVRFAVDGRFEFDSVAVRRSADGRTLLKFPGRRDGDGHERYFVRPLDDATRRAIEEAVFAELRRQGRLAS